MTAPDREADRILALYDAAMRTVCGVQLDRLALSLAEHGADDAELERAAGWYGALLASQVAVNRFDLERQLDEPGTLTSALQ